VIAQTHFPENAEDIDAEPAPCASSRVAAGRDGVGFCPHLKKTCTVSGAGSKVKTLAAFILQMALEATPRLELGV
jgi:hypothetical protein